MNSAALLFSQEFVGGALSNYPMALDEENHRLFIVCRTPTRFIVLDTNTGKVSRNYPQSAIRTTFFMTGLTSGFMRQAAMVGISVSQRKARRE